jgi:hypothetical protein
MNGVEQDYTSDSSLFGRDVPARRLPEDGRLGVPRALGPFESITIAAMGDHCYACFNREMADRLDVNPDARSS